MRTLSLTRLPLGHESYVIYGWCLTYQINEVGTYRRHMKSCTWVLTNILPLLEPLCGTIFLIYKSLHTGTKMTQRMFTLQLISALIGGRTYTHKRGRRTSNVPDRPAETRWNRDLVHAPEMLSTQSKCIVHTHRADTRYICRVCMQGENVS